MHVAPLPGPARFVGLRIHGIAPACDGRCDDRYEFAIQAGQVLDAAIDHFVQGLSARLVGNSPW